MQPATSSSPPALILQPGVAEFTDQIIASFLIIEQKLRMNEKAVKISEGKAMVFSRNALGGSVASVRA